MARARGVPPAEINALLERHITGRSLGIFGEPRVNVLDLNLALQRAYPYTVVHTTSHSFVLAQSARNLQAFNHRAECESGQVGQRANDDDRLEGNRHTAPHRSVRYPPSAE